MKRWCVPFLVLMVSSLTALAEDENAEIEELRQELQELKTDYETRIQELEERLERAERSAHKAERAADEAIEVAEETAISSTGRASSPSAFNPAIGLVLVGTYSDIGGDGWDTVPGFIPGGELGPGESGFSLGESELNMNANIDPLFFGNFTVAVADDGGETELELEEAWFQTLAVPHGFTLLGGRYFSELGYLNKIHRHADDFMEPPLPYQAFLGGQYAEDGLQARWVAPTSSVFLEFGGELNWGNSYPATGGDGTSPAAWTLFGHVGGDVGVSHAWLAGLSYLSVDVQDLTFGQQAKGDVFLEGFTGDSDLTVLDFVYKWAPEGNPTYRDFKLQFEYFWRNEDGEVFGFPYGGDQQGWYLQGVWKFMPRWRVGYRHGEVSTDNGMLFAGTILEDPSDDPKRDSFMIDWSYSEFSRLRFQYTYDRVLTDAENQFFLQYILSVGAHGAHAF
jgi:hypothetical protein